MRHSLRCALSGCNVQFHPRGNQRYCSPACSQAARRVQNRRAQILNLESDSTAEEHSLEARIQAIVDWIDRQE